MIGCGKARSILLDHVRGEVPEPVLLTLDQHLIECARCREEQARVATLGALKQWEPPSLSASARQRIARELAARAPELGRTRLPARRSPAPWLVAFSTATATVALFLGVRALRSAPKTTTPAPVVATASLLDGAHSLDWAGARLDGREGTHARLEAKSRTVSLDAGKLEVRSVASAPVTVRTSSLVMVIENGHAVFAGDEVHVVDGRVEVYSLDRVKLATLTADQSWPPPAPTTAPVTARAEGESAPAPLSPATALEHARTALADGDAPLARRFVERALAGARDRHDRAEAELFLAESYLVEHQADRAIDGYRRVARNFAHLPEGETATFALAQVLFEQGDRAGAAVELRRYLEQYPDGRFAPEAHDRLAELPAAP